MQLIASVIKLGLVIAVLKTLRAYLDPGSGSLIVQILVAIIVGALATFRLWKARLLALFGVEREADDDEHIEETENDGADQG